MDILSWIFGFMVGSGFGYFVARREYKPTFQSDGVIRGKDAKRFQEMMDFNSQEARRDRALKMDFTVKEKQ